MHTLGHRDFLSVCFSLDFQSVAMRWRHIYLQLVTSGRIEICTTTAGIVVSIHEQAS